ncbi:hypothetical protein I79_004819 [Cricetulus griseus]|uniref:Uncharacterized protein n=1 Tax=Cricetulus griseus TaxID=10029 RepID=G3H3M8_CRIGR|nr:hypothetical protein I79_004819 [Cricetulus griseus]
MACTRGQKTTYRSWFSPSTVWILEIKLELSGLVANALKSHLTVPAHPPTKSSLRQDHIL